MHARALPGLEPAFATVAISRTPDGGYTLSTWAGDGPGFIRRDEMDHYDRLTGDEALDVAVAVLGLVLRDS